MDLLGKQKIYIWVIISLILLNLTVVVLLWLNAPKPPVMFSKDRRFPVKDFFNKELGLSQEQQTAFDKLRDEHFKTIDTIIKQIDAKRSLMDDEMFRQNPDKAKIQQISDSIGRLTSEIEVLRAEHFSKLYSLLDQKQAEKFRNIVKETHKPGMHGPMPFKGLMNGGNVRPNEPMGGPGRQHAGGNPPMREGEMPPPPHDGFGH
jgi:Spy/CpxP family protein refolding chaperone